MTRCSTAPIALLLTIQALTFVAAAGTMLAFSPDIAHPPSGFPRIWSLPGLAADAAMGWATIRLIRGLLLAGGKNALSFPRTLSVWPG